MLDKSEIYHFLKSNGFELTKQSLSEYFGDYFDILSSSNFELIFSSSRSVETINIRSIKEEKDYDLALVKALLYKE